jgi:hypothetical protein
MSLNEVGRGESYVFSMEYLDDQGNPIDLSTHELRVQLLEPRLPYAAPLLDETVEELNHDGKIAVTFDENFTKKLLPGEYVLLVTDSVSGTSQWIYKDKFIVKEASGIE